MRICPDASFSARAADADVDIAAMLDARDDAGGSLIAVSCDNWFEKDARERV
jgi:hypothetical protein